MTVKEKVKKIIDLFLVIILLLLSIKKGGFYKNDSLEIQLVITGIGMIYVIWNYFYEIFQKKIRKKESESKVSYTKIDGIEILLFLLGIAYLIPILCGNASNLSDSIFEMIRYVDVWIVYCIVKRTNHPNIYKVGILLVTLVQCLLAIDGIANHYLADILAHINSGYLTLNNVTRMSGTIQYANVFSLLCLISSMYLVDWLTNIQENTEERKKRKRSQYVGVSLLVFIYFSSIVLAQSRMILLCYMLYLIYVLCKKGRKNKNILLLNLLMGGIYCVIVNRLLQSNPGQIYVITVIFYLLHIGIVAWLITLKKKQEKKSIVEYLDKKELKKKKKIKIVCYGIVTIFSAMYAISIFLVKVPIQLNSNANQKYVSRNIYQLKKNTKNEICVKIQPLHEDARFQVHFIQVNEKLENKTIESFAYYSNVSNTYTISYVPPEDFNYLIVHIECEKESLKVTDILVNQEKNYLDFALVPSDLMYRIIDSVHIDSSFKERFYFTKDALQIISKAPQNFFFGVGGDGFKNTYGQVKSGQYASTEVHNVYLQIFVEAGLLGFGVFLSIIYLVLKKSKKQRTTLLLTILLITSLFDLNFSFFFMLLLFAILLALVQKEKGNNVEKKIKNETVEAYLWHGYKITSCIFILLIFVLILRANIACYLKVPVINEGEVTLKEMATSVLQNEKRVMLDPFDNQYRLALLKEYEKYNNILKMYLSENSNEMLEEEYKNVLGNQVINLQMMQKNEKYNAQNYLYMLEYIFNEMEELMKIGSFESKESGYQFYLNLMIENLEYLKKLKNDSHTLEKVEFFQKQLMEKINRLKVENEI